MSGEYENLRRACYDVDGSNLQFIPVCPKCGRYVKADKSIVTNMDGDFKRQPNATCKKCGRVEMLSEGYF